MISSVIPSLKYSFSGSGLRFANGSTAIDLAAAGAGAGLPAGGVRSASANSVAVVNRSAGIFSSAFITACSTARGTACRTVRNAGTGSSEWRARTACGVGPVNGGPPASISYSTQPRL